MQTVQSNLYKLLSLAFQNSFTPASAKKAFSPYLTDQITLRNIKRNTSLVQMGDPVRKIVLLVTGQCHIIKYYDNGSRMIADSMKPVQLFGLYELLNEIPSYSASIVTIENCSVLEIPARLLLKQLESHIQSTLLITRYLSALTERSFNQRNREKLLTEYQNLLLYLYRHTFGKSAPVSLRLERKIMSEELNINLRTLYRYLNRLKEEQQISVVHGLIFLSEEQLTMLESRVRSF